MNKKDKTLEILNKLVTTIDVKKDGDKMIESFYNECLYFKQEIEEGRMMIPLDSIEGYQLSYIIAEDYFYNKEDLKKLVEDLYYNIVEYK